MPEPGFRYRLTLGKFQVKGVEHGLTGCRLAIDLGHSVVMFVDCPVSADVRIGDMLTFETEIMAKGN